MLCRMQRVARMKTPSPKSDPCLRCWAIFAALAAGCIGIGERGHLDDSSDATPIPIARSARAGDKLPLVVEIAANQPEYRIGDTITLTVTVRNPTDTTVTFFDDGGWKEPDCDYLDMTDDEFREMFPSITFPMPHGTEGHLDMWLPGGPVPRNTPDARFTTLEAGGVLTHTQTMVARTVGRWEIRSEVRSRQNCLIKGHYPCAGCFGFRPRGETPEAAAAREAAARERLPAERRREAEAGWRWNEERRYYQKVKSNVSLGSTYSNTLLMVVRSREEAREDSQ
jgi:hypothetical protein